MPTRVHPFSQPLMQRLSISMQALRREMLSENESSRRDGTGFAHHGRTEENPYLTSINLAREANITIAFARPFC